MISISDLRRMLLAFALPDSCLSCGMPLGAGERHVCPACLLRLTLGREPGSVSTGQGKLTVAFALDFSGPAGDLVRALKYGGRLSVASLLARLAAPTARRVAVDGTDRVVPVPLHAARLRERGFNQSRAIASLLAEDLGLELADGLQRIRPTRSQTGLSEPEREKNVAGAFGGMGRLAGLRVLLVDDVVTTGATLLAAAQAALADGAAAVAAVAVAGARGGAPRGESG